MKFKDHTLQSLQRHFAPQIRKIDDAMKKAVRDKVVHKYEIVADSSVNSDGDIAAGTLHVVTFSCDSMGVSYEPQRLTFRAPYLCL